MKLQSGMPLLYQQYKALLRKNLVLAKRNMSYTLIKLFSSCFFLLLLFCVEKILKASSAGEAVVDPKPLVSPPIPPCEDKFHIKTPCFDFLWSGRGSAQIKNIVTGIMVNNPGRPIPAKKVKSFRTKSQVDAWLFRNPLRCPGALYFSIVNKTVISYGIQTNFTATSKEGKKEDLTFKFFIPLQIATEREITRSLIGDPRFSWDVGFKKFAHPAEANSIDLTESLPLFFFAISMFGFVFQMSSLVVEKELKLRQAMSMMGLYDTAYWFSWLTWEGIITLLSSLLTVLFGMMFRLDFFIRNSFAVAFLLFFVFQLNMIGLAFMLSAFINKSSSATRVGFSIFLIGTLTQIATASGMIYTEVFPKKYRILWSFFPPNLLAEALTLLSEASEPDTDGISWSRRAECSPNNNGCVLTINDIYIWLASTFFLWFVLAIYLDNILPNAAGVRKPLFYFLNPGYWVGKDGNKVKEGSIFSLFGSVPLPEYITPDDEDVLEEENIVKQEAGEEKVDENVAVQIHGLIKTFPGTKKIGCCKWKETPPYHAVKGLWVNLAKNQLFCLLGPNGAGKTTTINCLTGITPVTDGDAFVHGNSIRSSIGMSNIRRIIGVCPQFDVLWDALSGEEHLYLFASIKGLQPASIGTISSKLLEDVKLSEASHMRSSSYSGGMKRRLSVAIALIGDPKLVILDEPTSGMDPITRRHVWDIIEEAKRGRAIVLTTHSMEEADILSDRIGIMAKGRLRCIGTSIRLKSRFGTGFIASVSFTRSIDGETPSNREAVATTRHEAVKKFFKHHLNIEPEEENEAFLTFVIPRDREDLLTNFFRKLQDSISEFGIADIQLGLATLEEVFLNIAKKAELESAAEERRLVTLTLTSGLSLQIPVGAQFVKIPGTESAENPKGVMVEVYWHQDDSGSLRIYDHSPEIPIPSHIQDSDATSNIFLARTGPIHGVVTDLSFLEKKD